MYCRLCKRMLNRRASLEYQVSGPLGLTGLDAYTYDFLFFFVRSLPLDAVTKIVESLQAQLPEESAPAVIVVKPERPLPSTRANARPDSSQGQYEPGMMYLLELTAILTLRDRQTIESLGECLLASLQGFIRDARNLHPLALSRVVTYLLNLLRLSYV